MATKHTHYTLTVLLSRESENGCGGLLTSDAGGMGRLQANDLTARFQCNKTESYHLTAIVCAAP
jgi:hypothetical protein